MTRAVISVMKLDFTMAFHFHPMVFSLPILIWYYLYDGEPISNKYINIALIVTVFVGFAIVWVLRLMKILPFTN